MLTFLAEWRRTEAEFQAAEAERKRQAAERREKTVAEWLARSEDDLLVKRWDGVRQRWGISHPYDLDTRDPRVAERLPRLRAIADERQRADDEAAAALRRKREARAQAEEHERQEQFAEWVETLCSDVQRRRRGAGLMTDEEVLAIAEEAVFTPLAGFERHRGITEEEVVEAADFRAGEVDIHSRKAEALTDAEFERLEAVRAAMRAAGHEAVEVEAQEHLGENDDEVMVRRIGILVAVTVGGWTMRREYAAGAEKQDGRRAEAA